MICKNLTNNVVYEYTFEEGGNVRLRNKEQDFMILYEDWCNDYLIIDKWKKLMK